LRGVPTIESSWFATARPAFDAEYLEGSKSKKRDETRRAEIRELLSEQRASGLSVAPFARERGISAGSRRGHGTTGGGGCVGRLIAGGAGAELCQGLGAVIVGGLFLSTLFTLFLVPVLLSLGHEVLAAFGKREARGEGSQLRPAQA